jgi:hypothetical protein
MYFCSRIGSTSLVKREQNGHSKSAKVSNANGAVAFPRIGAPARGTGTFGIVRTGLPDVCSDFFDAPQRKNSAVAIIATEATMSRPALNFDQRAARGPSLMVFSASATYTTGIQASVNSAEDARGIGPQWSSFHARRLRLLDVRASVRE